MCSHDCPIYVISNVIKEGACLSRRKVLVQLSNIVHSTCHTFLRHIIPLMNLPRLRMISWHHVLRCNDFQMQYDLMIIDFLSFLGTQYPMLSNRILIDILKMICTIWQQNHSSYEDLYRNYSHGLIHQVFLVRWLFFENHSVIDDDMINKIVDVSNEIVKRHINDAITRYLKGATRIRTPFVFALLITV